MLKIKSMRSCLAVSQKRKLSQSRAIKYREGSMLVVNLIKVAILLAPIVGLTISMYLLFTGKAESKDVWTTVICFLLGGLGITVGFHRYATHGSFETNGVVKAILLILGSMTWQGQVVFWVTTHRMHHAYSDEENDPHSPRYGFPNTRLGLLKGLAHAQWGWLRDANVTDADIQKFSPKLAADPMIKVINYGFPIFSALSIAIPVVLHGWNVSGALCALSAVCLVHNVTWSVNSVCHVFGSRPYNTGDMSTNNFFVGLFALGEGWHNNHHVEPRSAFHGFRWYQIDLSGYVIRLLEAAHLAQNVMRPRQAMLDRKLT